MKFYQIKKFLPFNFLRSLRENYLEWRSLYRITTNIHVEKRLQDIDVKVDWVGRPYIFIEMLDEKYANEEFRNSLIESKMDEVYKVLSKFGAQYLVTVKQKLEEGYGVLLLFDTMSFLNSSAYWWWVFKQIIRDAAFFTLLWLLGSYLANFFNIPVADFIQSFIHPLKN